jgi:hypothetical protein
MYMSKLSRLYVDTDINRRDSQIPRNPPIACTQKWNKTYAVDLNPRRLKITRFWILS